MSITDLPLFNMLRTKMQWHQERQRMLSENVANADSPNFKPRDLMPPQFDRMHSIATSVGLARTEGRHIAVSAAAPGGFQNSGSGGFESRISGSLVNLEDEMIKVAANQMDYQAATTLYTRSLGLLKTALGKR